MLTEDDTLTINKLFADLYVQINFKTLKGFGQQNKVKQIEKNILITMIVATIIIAITKTIVIITIIIIITIMIIIILLL